MPQVTKACSPLLLSPYATTTEAHVPWILDIETTERSCGTTEGPAPRAWTLQRGEATTMRSLCITTKSSPCSAQLEKAHSQQQRPSATKSK